MLRLDEDLFDDVIEIDVPDVEADITIDPDLSGPETPEDMGQATILLDAISCIAKNIDQYNVLKANLTDPEMIAVVDEMATNENTNLGKLQTLLKKVSPNAENIMNGAVEAEQELSESLNKGDTVVIVTTTDKNGKERLVVCKDMETAKKLHPRFKQRNVYPVQSIDSKNESLDEDKIADRIKANQDTKKMTKQAINTLKRIGGQYKDLAKEFEDTYDEPLDEAENKWEDAEWRKYHGVDDDSFYDDNIETFGSPYSEEEPDDEFDDNYDSSIIMKLLSQEEVDDNNM